MTSTYMKLAAEPSTSPQEPINFEPSVGHTQHGQNRDGHLQKVIVHHELLCLVPRPPCRPGNGARIAREHSVFGR